MSVTTLTQENFAHLATKPGFILIDFSAEWCPPCKVMKPIFEAFSQDSDLSHIVFCTLDVDDQPVIAQAYQVSSIPTFIILKVEIVNNSPTLIEVKRWIGAQPNPLSFKTEILQNTPKITTA